MPAPPPYPEGEISLCGSEEHQLICITPEALGAVGEYIEALRDYGRLLQGCPGVTATPAP